MREKVLLTNFFNFNLVTCAHEWNLAEMEKSEPTFFPQCCDVCFGRGIFLINSSAWAIWCFVSLILSAEPSLSNKDFVEKFIPFCNFNPFLHFFFCVRFQYKTSGYMKSIPTLAWKSTRRQLPIQSGSGRHLGVVSKSQRCPQTSQNWKSRGISRDTANFPSICEITIQEFWVHEKYTNFGVKSVQMLFVFFLFCFFCKQTLNSMLSYETWAMKGSNIYCPGKVIFLN